MSLDNQTPADRVGIKIKGKNKWITLIQNATNNQYGTKSNGDSA